MALPGISVRESRYADGDNTLFFIDFKANIDEKHSEYSPIVGKDIIFCILDEEAFELAILLITTVARRGKLSKENTNNITARARDERDSLVAKEKEKTYYDEHPDERLIPF